MAGYYPLIVLGVGIAVVLGLIIVARANAFLALITAAMVVSLLSEGAAQDKIARVATAFGNAAGNIGIVIALAAIIGQCMLDSGAADRVVRSFTGTLGEKRAPLALVASGYVLSIPVFFDTVFYLLVPLARSLYQKTGKNYLTYLLAICVGGTLTHTLVPPTPGPLVVAAQLQVDLGLMMLIGAIVAIPAALVGLALCSMFDRALKVPFRKIPGEQELAPLADHQLPSLFWSLLPVILPVLMITANTVLTTMADAERPARLRPEQVNFVRLGELVTQAAQSSADRSPQAQVMARVLELTARNPQSGNATAGTAGDTAATSAPTSPLTSLAGLSAEPSAEVQTAVVAALNDNILTNKQFYDSQAFGRVVISDETQKLLAGNSLRMKPVDAERMNRAVLKDAWGDVLADYTWETPKRQWSNWGDLFGNANLALLISAVVAMAVLRKQRQLGLHELAQSVEASLMSGGVIILITAGGGAFGKMLEVANVGKSIETLFTAQVQGQSAGMLILLLGFVVTVVLKFAQGSSTVAMITASSMLASVATVEALGFHPVYLATAIGGGSLVGSWMNDSGFWIYSKMGGLTEAESLKSWTPMLAILGTASFLITLVMAKLLPLLNWA